MNTQTPRYNNQTILNTQYSNTKQCWYWILNIGICLVFVSWLLIINAKEASAGVILKAPPYIGLNEGLVGYWSFDGPDMSQSTNNIWALDRSGNGNHGRLINTATSTARVIGKIGQALDFDGSNDYVQVAGITSSFTIANPWTLNCWGKLDTAGLELPEVCGLHDAGSEHDGPKIGGNNATDGGDEIKITTFGETPGNGSTFSIGEWHMFTMIWDGTKFNAYLDGVFDYAVTPTGSDWKLADDLRMGHEHDTGTADDFWDGLIDEVRVYNRALSADEIKRLYKIGSTFVVNKPRTDTLNEGLVGYWSFDGPDMAQGAGNPWALDRSGNGNNGELTNGPRKAVGRIGQALEFDGTNDYVNMGTAPDELINIDEKTISLWFRAYTFGTTGFGTVVAFDAFSGDVDPWSFFLDSTENRLNYAHFFSVVGEWGTPTNSIAVNNWYHAVVVFNRGSSTNDPTIYLNGVEQTITEIRTPSGTAIDEAAATDFIIGASNDGNEDFFDGLIDEVRIYNRALSADEIKRLYKIGSTFVVNKTRTDTLTEGLVGHWSFDGPDMAQGAGNPWALDRSGNGNNGELTNGPRKAVGRIGQALEFDGSDDYVDMGTAPDELINIDEKTISLWFRAYTFGTTGFGTVVAFDSPDADVSPWSFFLDNTENRLNYGHYFSVVGEWGTPTNSIAVNNWYHAVVVFNRGSSTNDPTIYLNGVKQTITEIRTPSGTAVDEAIATNFIIGASNNATDDFFDGQIDEVRIYNRVLSPDEIKRLYNMGR
jgi:hypothetical protein